MERRLEELQPALEEADLLHRSVERLRAELAASANAAYEGIERQGKDSKDTGRHQEHLALELRRTQITRILGEDPKATNRKIGSILGISGARVGQIRKLMDEEDSTRGN
jgi:hypothetical protein